MHLGCIEEYRIAPYILKSLSRQDFNHRTATRIIAYIDVQKKMVTYSKGQSCCIRNVAQVRKEDETGLQSVLSLT